MNRLPKEIKKDLKKEAKEWDRTIAKESPEHVQKMLDQAESFQIPRPPRQPVSIRYLQMSQSAQASNIFRAAFSAVLLSIVMVTLIRSSSV